MGAAIQGPSPFVMRTSDGPTIIGGDSITSYDTDTQMPMRPIRKFIATCRRGGVTPLFYNHAVSNTSLAQELLRLQTNIPKYGCKKYIGILGTAPIILGNTIGTVNDTTNATILGAFRLILDITAGSGIPTYIATVAFVGEKFPTGANALDANIDLLVAGMATIAARYLLCTFRDLRYAVYTVNEPVLNTANTSIGPLSRPDGVFAHHNPFGRGVSDQIITNDFQFVADGPPAAAATPYSSVALPNQGSLGILLDSDSLANVGDGSNVTITWPNSAPSTGLGTLADLTTTPATKPIWRASASGKTWSGVEFGGATWMRSAAFPTGTIRSQPFMTVMMWRSANLTASQILYDGTTAQQEASLATILTSGVCETNAGVVFDGRAVVATNWNVAICYWAGNRAGSYQVINGFQSILNDTGANFTRTQLTIGAAAANGLPATIQVKLFAEYYSQFGPLPRWQDVYQSIVNARGAFPQ